MRTEAPEKKTWRQMGWGLRCSEISFAELINTLLALLKYSCAGGGGGTTGAGTTRGLVLGGLVQGYVGMGRGGVIIVRVQGFRV